MHQGLLQYLIISLLEPCRVRLTLQLNQIVQHHPEAYAFLMLLPRPASPFQAVIVRPASCAELKPQRCDLSMSRIETHLNRFKHVIYFSFMRSGRLYLDKLQVAICGHLVSVILRSSQSGRKQSIGVRTEPHANTVYQSTARCVSHVTFKRFIVGISLLLSAFLGISAHTQNQGDDEPNSTSDDFLQLQLLYDEGRFGEVVSSAQELIDDIRSRIGHFDTSLVEPMRLKGDSQIELTDYEEAIASYEQAMQIVRMATGPYSLAQIEIAYRLADAYVALRDGTNANKMYEFTYEVSLKEHGEYNLKILPELERLLTWYENNRYFYHARILHQKALTIMRSNFPASDLRLIEMKRVFANGVKRAVFPLRERSDVIRGFYPHIPGYQRKFHSSVPSVQRGASCVT